MKLGDLPLGLLAGLFGLAVVLEAMSFPEMGGMAYGPEFFPIIVGAGFCLCGLVLIAGDLRRRLTGKREALVSVEPSLKQGKALLRAAAVLVTVIAFVLLVKPLGFLLTLALLLFFLLRCLAAGWGISLALALGLPFALHFCFTSLLRVPLPRGFVETLLF
ncbi:tripartite tricarboxylate transporter TctB family protein [Pelagibius litoralis]|uniref:Tripartite tricarboxylate transporter TctB family protein n=1 Tax=Pelagibius litoralis TaxID=374515 RepID=A0A967C1R2_9PROT|nr:tripartite tricarboxylate transporter TctB family protein [Pelagibius litoralis]NIA67681.1 tripartite tricarboxylate transporter TctB family protein [Pelagibius litoralis]